MSAPLLWIGLPVGGAFLLWFLRERRGVALLGSALALLLTFAAWQLPIEIALPLGKLSFKIESSWQILGRRFFLSSSHQLLLMLLYGATAWWLIASEAAHWARRMVPYGLVISALCVAALAVEPFLYAGILLEVVALLAAPLVTMPGTTNRRGVLRLITLETLALPFILFAGWSLTGKETGPTNFQALQPAALILALGFSLLLAAFPFHTWLPMLSEEGHPYAVSFLFWIFPTTATLFGLSFIDHYVWLRESAQITVVLRFSGLLLMVIGGLSAAFQRHLGRIFGFTIVAENGLSLVALSLGNKVGVEFFFLLLIPRALAMILWGLSLATLQEAKSSLSFERMQGALRSWPLAAAGVIISHLSLIGMPLLASFPVRQVIWENLAQHSVGEAAWLLISTLGMVMAWGRTFTILATAAPDTAWHVEENMSQRLFLGLGGLMLFVLGLFPQWASFILAYLPNTFEHLGK